VKKCLCVLKTLTQFLRPPCTRSLRQTVASFCARGTVVAWSKRPINLFDVDDVGMFETSDDVHLTRQELLEELFGRQVVVDDLHCQVSTRRQVHRFLDDRKRPLAQLVPKTISVLQEHHLEVDGALHVRHGPL